MNLIGFGTISHIKKGKKPLRQVDKPQDGYMPYVDIEAFETGNVKMYTDGEKCLPCKAGDILIVCDGSRSGFVGKAIDGYVGSTLAIISADGMSQEYLYYFLQGKYALLNTKKKGTGTPHLDANILNQQKLVVPSLEEQKRIVTRIEELFSELDNGVETLKKTKQQLAVYRQAVLKNAFDGKLNGCTSMQEVALKDLVSGKDGLRRGPFGSAIKKAFFVPDGFKVYEQGNAINNDPYRGHYYITQEKYEELKNFHIKPHDLLVSCSGVTLGRIVELPENAEPGVINQALLRIRLNHEMIATRYFIEYFRSEMFQRKIFDKSQGSAMPNLVGITEFREITLNVPALIDEQLAIVSEIESRLSVCDNIEKTVNTALQQAEAMRQSILKKAFEGTL